MFGIKCKVKGKTFRGQDFENRYCSVCPYWRREKISLKECPGGITQVTINCPSLVLIETYRPKRNSHIDTSKLPKVGQAFPLSYEVHDDSMTHMIRIGRYKGPEPK